MKHIVPIGQTDYTVLVKMRDTAGAPVTGLDETDIDIAYARVETDNDVSTADVTPATLASLTAAHSDWGFEEVSATDHPGVYRLDIADAVFASGAWSAVVTITGTGLDPADLEFQLGPIPADVIAIRGSETSAANLERSASVLYRGAITGSPTTTTFVDTSLTQSETNHFNGRVVIFTSGTLAGQAALITAFTPGTDTLTFTTRSQAPSTSDTYVIV